MRSTLLLLVSFTASPAAAQTVVLDPGHGGADPGAVGCMGLEESGVVLDVAQRTRAQLEAEGLTVELTRDDDRAVGLTARATFANGIPADLFVSVHSNANAGTPATGTETFIANTASATSVILGGHLQREMIAAWGLRDRGLKRANFTVITATRMPAALTELGFTNRCDPDAALLRDPDARADAAEAHARAVLLTLGEEPTVGGTGTLLGVVFEDRGAGLEDTSLRIDTATVLVDGTTLPVNADTALFRIDLPPGSYAVQAAAPGFDPASRTCAVTDGGETWCSVGVRVAGSSPSDAGPPPPDAGPGPSDAGRPVDADAPPAEDASVEPPGTDRPGASDGCSCRAAGPSSSPPVALLLLLAGLVLLRRRARPRALLLGLLAVGCAEPAASTGATVLSDRPGERASASIEIVEVGPSAALVGVTPLAEGLVEPVVSPDGRRVAMSSPDHDALWLHADGALEALAAGPRVGFRPRFVGGALRYRHAGQSATAVPHHAVALDGHAEPDRPATAWVHVDDAHRVVLRQAGQPPRVISPEGDRYMVPELAPDGRHVVFWGVATGVHLYRVADGASAALGAGGHPSFDASGRWLVHDRTTDDGHRLTAGTLHLVDLERYRRVPIETPSSVAYQPSLAAGRLAYTTPEGVLAGQLVVGR